MHKLLNLMLLVTLIVTACFVTGCGNTDDDWKNPVSNEPVLTFTLGFTQRSIPSNSRADVGAIEPPKSVTVEGKPFRQTSDQNMVCFVGELPKTIIDFIRNQGYARMSLDFTSYSISKRISYDFFVNAYQGRQPNASLVLVLGSYDVVSAKANGQTVVAPKIEDDKEPVADTKVKMQVNLDANPESVVLTVPASAGLVNAFTNWTITLYDNTNHKNITFSKGEFEKYYDEIPGNGNNLTLLLTPEGKQLLTKDHNYTGILVNLKVQLSNGTIKDDLDISQCIADNVSWNK